MNRDGHAVQVVFNYNRQFIDARIRDIFEPAKNTSDKLGLALEDLFEERIKYLSQYCAEESVYMVLWTRPSNLTREQLTRANKDKLKMIKEEKIPPFRRTQNLVAQIPD